MGPDFGGEAQQGGFQPRDHSCCGAGIEDDPGMFNMVVEALQKLPQTKHSPVAGEKARHEEHRASIAARNVLRHDKAAAGP